MDSLLEQVKAAQQSKQREKQAEDMFSRLVEEYADRQGVTEQLKEENQPLWVQRMNNIRACAGEFLEIKQKQFGELKNIIISCILKKRNLTKKSGVI